MKKIPLTLISISLLASAHASTLACFEFTGNSLAVSSELYAGSTSVITLNASPTNLTVNADALDFTASGAGVYAGFLGAPANSFSFTYTVTGLTGAATLDISSLEFDIANNSGGTRVSAIVSGQTFGSNTVTTGTNTAAIVGAPTGLVNGDVVTIEFGIRGGSADPTATLDNFKLIGVIPEPSSAALLGLGALALVARRKR